MDTWEYRHNNGEYIDGDILLEIRWIMEVETGAEIHVVTFGLRLWNSKMMSWKCTRVMF